jgi:hypothetical protein
MKKYSVLAILAWLMFFCFLNCKRVEMETSNMDIYIDIGDSWLGPRNHGPQVVVWIEDEAGKYVATVFITQKSAKKSFNRPEALPVWNHIETNLQNIDAVSGATSKAPTYQGYLNTDLLTKGAQYKVFLEINNSFDYNDFWDKKNSGVNGQPSLIYCSTFTAGQKETIDIPSTSIGYGSVDGSNGTVTAEINNFTTALKRINGAHIKINQ